MTKIVPVLLAGGAGTRLWPVSRDALPKQFLPLVGERSSYQEALLRVRNPELFAPPIVVTNADFRFFARRQADDLGIDATVAIEPMRRDSGPAVAAAAVLARRHDPDAVVLMLAADHVILDVEAFHAACVAGHEAAQAGRIVTFGIKPTEPKTSYGYIRRGKTERSKGRLRGRGLCRETGCRHCRALCLRRLSLELRQLPVPRRRAAGGVATLRARDRSPRSKPPSTPPRTISVSCDSIRLASAARRRSRSTTR